MDIDNARSMAEELLESFVTAALGLAGESRIRDVNQLQEVLGPRAKNAPDSARACSAWHTANGRLTACGTYHHDLSQRTKFQVLWLEWWIPPNQHHEGWWRCEPKWPRDWIKGLGTS
jgi:hypothetical protein